MYDVVHPITGKVCKKPISGWRYPTPQRLQEEIDKGHVVFGKDETTVPRVRMNLFESEKEVMRSVFFSYAQTATNEFTQIFGGKRVFDNPKPLSDIKKLTEYITSGDDIILDFVSGSATTAHAVMQLNAEDGGNRQFILVQLPEACDEQSEAYRAGYKNICEIGKERIRRAGTRIIEEKAHLKKVLQETMFEPMQAVPYVPNSEEGHERQKQERIILDVGFRVFKLDTTNLKTWDATPIEDGQVEILYDRMNQMVQQVKPERTDMDMVCEVMLKLGVPLTYPITQIELNGKTAYSVGDDALLLVCLAPGVSPEDVEAMASDTPGKIVIARESFADDTAMANAYYILRDRKIELKLV